MFQMIKRILITVWLLSIANTVTCQCYEIQQFFNYIDNVSNLHYYPDNRSKTISSCSVKQIETVKSGKGEKKKEIVEFYYKYDTLGQLVNMVEIRPPYKRVFNATYLPDSLFTWNDSSQCSAIIPYYHDHVPIYQAHFTITKYKKNRLMSTWIWDPSLLYPTMLGIRHSFLKKNRITHKERSVTQLQKSIFDFPITNIPVQFFLCELHADSASNCNPNDLLHMMESLKDTSIYYSMIHSNMKWSIYYFVDFNPPFYSISMATHNYVTGKHSHYRSSAIIHYDGRPHEFYLFEPGDGTILGKKSFEYDKYGNLLKTEWNTDKIKVVRTFNYEYFPEA